MKNAFNVLDDEIGLSKENMEDLEHIISALNGKDNQWKKPATYHITQLFIGRNKEKL